jgi:hypothetical protein
MARTGQVWQPMGKPSGSAESLPVRVAKNAAAAADVAVVLKKFLRDMAGMALS